MDEDIAAGTRGDHIVSRACIDDAVAVSGIYDIVSKPCPNDVISRTGRYSVIAIAFASRDDVAARTCATRTCAT
nr:hypothetical protein [Gemmobacter aquarius]